MPIEGKANSLNVEQLRQRLQRFGRTLRDILYGMSIYDWVREVEKDRAALESLFTLFVFGDMLGMPLLPPYYTLRLLPYAMPHIAAAQRRMLREKDLTDLLDQDLG